MKNSRTKLNRDGFTLVELIIVISIIAILAALSFIALSGETSNARDAKRDADLKVIEDAISTSNAKARSINYGIKTGAGGGNGIETNAGFVGAIRGAKITEVDEKLFDATILPTSPRDPKGSKYIGAFLTNNLYQLVAVKENADTKIPTTLIKGSFREGAVVDQLTSDVDAAATSISVNNPNQFLQNDVLTIDSEDLTVGDMTDATATTIPVARAANSTTANQHKKSAPIKLKTFATDAESIICFNDTANPATATTCGAGGALKNEDSTLIPYSIN